MIQTAAHIAVPSRMPPDTAPQNPTTARPGSESLKLVNSVPPSQPKVESPSRRPLTDEPILQLSANFASANPPAKRRQNPEESRAETRKATEEVPKYVVPDDHIQKPTQKENKTRPDLQNSPSPGHSSTSFSIMSDIPAARLETSAESPGSGQRPHDADKPQSSQRPGQNGDAPSKAPLVPNYQQPQAAQDHRPTIQQQSQQKPPAVSQHWQHSSVQHTIEGPERPQPGYSTLATNPMPISPPPAVHPSYPTPPPSQGFSAPPAQTVFAGSPASSQASPHRTSLPGQSSGAPIYGTATPPPSSQQLPSQAPMTQNQSPNASATGSPSAHRISLSGASSGSRPQGQSTPPPTQNIVHAQQSPHHSPLSQQSPVPQRPPSGLASGPPEKVPAIHPKVGPPSANASAGPLGIPFTDAMPRPLNIQRPPNVTTVHPSTQSQSGGTASSYSPGSKCPPAGACHGPSWAGISSAADILCPFSKASSGGAPGARRACSQCLEFWHPCLW